LLYEFVDVNAAYNHLMNRGVKGLTSFGNENKTFVKESFYYDSQEAAHVINSLVPNVKKGEPPNGSR
jgi:hypothetical protein